MSGRAEPCGRAALLTGSSAIFIAATFAFLHKTVFQDWPVAALDGPTVMLAYFSAGVVFQFGIPILCFATLIYGAPARALWTARAGSPAPRRHLRPTRFTSGRVYR